MKPMSLVRSMVVFMLALLMAGCADTGGGSNVSSSSSSNVSSGTVRVYNPETKNYEWRIPDQPSTSPGASNTSRQSFR
ncbi:hypothetical protein ACXR0O_00995 [Verrucomicrobiota bacterium sgz303538]